MQNRQLGPLSVSTIGLGCMGLSYAYGTTPAEADAVRTIRQAVDHGITFFDTAEVYGPFENEILLGKALAPLRRHVTIATKFGFRISDEGVGPQRQVGVDSRPEHVRSVAEASLRRLGVEVIDLFYQHRVDPLVPIEETVGAMAELVAAGKVRALGLSEASAETIRRAHAVHPIAAVQSEYSLWSREPEADIIPLCAELGIGFVPYSPLGRGFLTGAIRSRADLEPGDFRLGLPRFQEANFAANLVLADRVQEMALARGCTAAQLALAWVLAKGDAIVPIPGTKRIANIVANAGAAAISLSPAEVMAIETAQPGAAIAGKRYTDAALGLVGR